MKLNALRINSDQELDRWKSQWNGVDEVPAEVHRYMQEVVIPRSDAKIQKLLTTVDKIVQEFNENKMLASTNKMQIEYNKLLQLIEKLRNKIKSGV